jgi:Tol biopolymer transport system component
VIVFAPDANGPLHRVPAAGGVSAPLTTLDKSQQETAHIFPQFLPDGQRFLYWARGAKTGIYVQSLGSNERTFVLATPGRALFASGFLLFLRDNTLLAQHLDLKSLQVEGEPVTVAEDVRTGGANGRNGFSVSENGVLAYRSGNSAGNIQLAWHTRDGRMQGKALASAEISQIELSPDDKQVVVERAPTGSGSADLWLLDLSTNVFSRLTSGADSERDPLWSPDSRRIMYSVPDGKEPGIREVAIGGADSPVFADGKANFLDDWSHDGKSLLYHTTPGATVSVLPLSGERKPQVVFQTPFQKDQVRVSPDGRWVAYMSLESANQPEVYVAAFPSFTDRRQISTGGLMPRWRSDGKEFFYVSLDRKMMAAEVKLGSTLQLGAVKPLFQLPAGTQFSPTGYGWAVTADGQKFLVREPVGVADAGAIEPMNIVLNWPAALAR